MSYFESAREYTDNEKPSVTPVVFSGINFGLEDLFKYEGFFELHTITETQEYRSDKIANDLYGDENKSWIIDELNRVMHPRELFKGRKILHIPYEQLINIGLA